MGTLVGDKDIDFFDSRTREVNRLAGTSSITYFSLDFKATPKDPLYGEPVQEVHARDQKRQIVGVQFNGVMEYPERSARTGEEGLRSDYDAILWLSRKDFEEKFPIASPPPGGPYAKEPKFGDIVLVQGRYYDVTEIQMEGQFNDSVRKFSTWWLKLKRLS